MTEALEGAGFRQPDTATPPPIRLDPKPEAPDAGVGWEVINVPNPRALKTGVWNKILSWVLGPGEAIILPDNPQDTAGVEHAVRQLIGLRPDLFGGLRPDQFRTVGVNKVKGQAGLADMIYVRFVQTKDTIGVDGTYLNFSVKILEGKTVVVGTTARLFPEVNTDPNADTTGRFTPDQIRGIITERLGPAAEWDHELRDMDRRIMNVNGRWRTLHTYLFQAPSRRFVAMIGVDINTGEAFAWDPRMHVATPGGAQARGVADGPYVENKTLDVLALPNLEIQGPNGKKYYTAADGTFTVEAEGEAPVTLTVRLAGKFAKVEDQERKDLVATVTAKPGERLQVIFNPEGQDQGAVAQVNAYYHTNIVHDWLVARGIDIAALNEAMPVKVNIDDECNAYYTPWSPSLNFFKVSVRCSNSSYNDVNYHEYGHAVDDAAGGIINGGLSEGWGDILAMFITGQPVIGRGFLKGADRDYIRHGDNTTPYRKGDEVHRQGEVWGGFAWKLRKNLIASMGDPGRAGALAEALVLPVFFASVRDIPTAIQQVLLRDIDANGNAPHLKEIQAAAKAHGIDVRMPKAGESEGLFQQLAGISADWAAALTSRAAAPATAADGTKNLE